MNGLRTASADDPGTRAYTVTARVDGDRVFRAARRHSRRVRVLRIGIPFTVATGLGLILAAVWFNPLRAITRIPANIAGLVISGTKVTMEQPRLSGYTKDGNPYELNAHTAAQDITKPTIVELRELRADVAMQDSSKVNISALNGVYDTKEEKLSLRDNIFLISSTGYEGRLSEASVDIRKGIIISEKPVAVKLLNGTLDANRLEVTESGDLVRFHSGVKMIMTMGPARTAEATGSSK